MIHNIKTENIHVEKDELLSSRVNLNEDQKAEVLQGLINKHVDKYDSDTLDVENNIIIINPRLYDDIDRYNQILLHQTFYLLDELYSQFQDHALYI